jgi:protein gp37
MGKDTNIEWCDSTINGTSGCDGCELWNWKHRTCYAGNLQTRRLSKSLPSLYSADFSEVRMIPGRYAQAASWSDLRGMERPDKPWLNGMPRCIFVGDLGDTFSRAVTDDYLTRELLGAITSKQGRRHFWMLLTKRPKRLAELSEKWGGLPRNVMAMTTVTNQTFANIRIRELLDVRCYWRGLSIEPMLGPVDLQAMPLDLDNQLFRYWPLTGAHIADGYNEPRVLPGSAIIHWVICGGESGTNARPMHPDWARSLRDQCSAAGVPFFFKQWGNYAPCPIGDGPDLVTDAVFKKGPGHDGQVWNIGKTKAGRLLDGREWNEFPHIGGAAS